MANRHVRAVQNFSQIADHRTRHVLEIIALDIGENDEPAHTGYRGIAKRARIAVNTVQNDIDTLIQSGELIAIRDGQYIFYSLNTELIPVSRTSGSSANEKDASSGKRLATQDDIEQLYQKLYQMSEQLYQKVYQNTVSTVSRPVERTDTEDKKDLKEERKKEIYINSPSPKNGASHHEYLPEPVQQFVTALSGISKTPYLFDGIEAYHEAAYYLHGEDAELADIDRFSDWWHRYGFYEGQPALKTIIDSWRNFKNGVVPKLSKEKKRQDINSAIPAEYADVIQR